MRSAPGVARDAEKSEKRQKPDKRRRDVMVYVDSLQALGSSRNAQEVMLVIVAVKLPHRATSLEGNGPAGRIPDRDTA